MGGREGAIKKEREALDRDSSNDAIASTCELMIEEQDYANLPSARACASRAALAPLGFVRVAVPTEQRAVGWTLLIAECTLASGARVRMEISATGTSPPRFTLSGPTGAIELMCSRRDPAFPKATTISHAMS